MPGHPIHSATRSLRFPDVHGPENRWTSRVPYPDYIFRFERRRIPTSQPAAKVRKHNSPRRRKMRNPATCRVARAKISIDRLSGLVRNRRSIEAPCREFDHSNNLLMRQMKPLHDLRDGGSHFQIVKDNGNRRPRVAKHPCAAALAGDALHGRALRPIECCHISDRPSLLFLCQRVLSHTVLGFPIEIRPTMLRETRRLRRS